MNMESPVHEARDEANRFARLIANYVAGGLAVPADLLDEYRRARGAVDRLVEEANPGYREAGARAFFTELAGLPDPEPTGGHACPGGARCLHASHRVMAEPAGFTAGILDVEELG